MELKKNIHKMKKDIFIILPFKESLDPNYTGAVSLYVKNTTKYSKFKKRE